MEFPKILQHGEIELVKLDPTFENTNKVFDLIDTDREYLGKWLNWVDYVKTPEDEFLTVKEASKPENTGYFIKYKNEIVGRVGFNIIKEKNKSGEIGYWLSSKFNGLGIMTNAVKLLENFAFDKIDLNRIEIHMDPENPKSESVAKRLGYVKEGCLRKNILLNNEFRDTLIYSKLKSEWEKENKDA